MTGFPNTMQRNSSSPVGFSPSDFMRSRRPELFSDTKVSEDNALDKDFLAFSLNSITAQKKENEFEHFCRRLAEKEICPNLLPQTGPTGGGDSKVDSETYPVSTSIADRWYEGDPQRSSCERWAFAFSAQRTWRTKIRDDVAKIVSTKRAYTLICFVTNQAVRDKARASIEQELQAKHGVEVRVFDRTWIIEKIVNNRRWDVVQTLGINPIHRETTSQPGPLDVERTQNLLELEELISDQQRYQGTHYQLTEDCLNAALLTRALGRPRAELDGRFDRAERIARNANNGRQLFRILYQRAWTANWWYDDFAEFDRYYWLAAPLALQSDWVWDLELLVNLWDIGTTWRHVNCKLESDGKWKAATLDLRSALKRQLNVQGKPTSVLWARTQLALMNLAEAGFAGKDLLPVLRTLAGLLNSAKGHVDYPTEPIVRIMVEVGQAVGESNAYDRLLESVIASQGERMSAGERGRIHLERARQKLNAGLAYGAIHEASKAQRLLRQHERLPEYIRALTVTGLAYEAAGLLWAARANMALALDRFLYLHTKHGEVLAQTPTPLRRLVWLELQLGRPPCVMAFAELLHAMNLAVVSPPVSKEAKDEFFLMDAVLSILVLRTRHQDWNSLDRVPGLLEALGLLISRGAALFSLGHEELFRKEYERPNTDLDAFFSLTAKQPAANDLPSQAEWHLGRTVKMKTTLLGCEIELIAENRTTTLILGEAILSFLEALLSTAMDTQGQYATASNLVIEIGQSGDATIPLTCRSESDDCGETRVVVTHAAMSAAKIAETNAYQDAFRSIFASVVLALQVPFSTEQLRKFLKPEHVHDRALLAAQLPIAVANALGDMPKYYVADWQPLAVDERLPLVRAAQWLPATDPNEEANFSPSAPTPVSPADRSALVESFKHRDVRIVSPINMRLWDQANWRALGFAWQPGRVPYIMLLFADIEAGSKIFRGWRRRIGEIDEEDWIGLTLITGVDSRHPTHYRAAISVGDQYLARNMGQKGLLVMACRYQEMTPKDSRNLDFLREVARKGGSYRLVPALFSNAAAPVFRPELSIEKRRMRVVPASEMASDDPAIGAVGKLPPQRSTHR